MPFARSTTAERFSRSFCKKEKTSKFKALIETLLETDGQGPDAGIANLGNLIDKRKLARIKWLPLELLPALRDEQGNELGRELTEYILTQSVESPTAPSPHVLNLKGQFCAASAADLFAEVLRTWLDQGAPAKENGSCRSQSPWVTEEASIRSARW